MSQESPREGRELQPADQNGEYSKGTGRLIVPELLVREKVLPVTDQYQSKIVKMPIAVDPVALITTECITVTSSMRKHVRWAHSSVSAILGGGASSSYRQGPWPQSPREKSHEGRRKTNGSVDLDRSTTDDDDSLAGRWGFRGTKGKSMQDNPLITAFARLRSDLRGCTGQSRSQLWRDKAKTKTRHQELRYPLSTSSIPTSHPLLFYLSSDHLSGYISNHQIFCLRIN